MAIANLSDIDVRIRDAVTRQLEWDPEVDASAIGVAAKDGAVTLTGYIDTYAGKLAAERAAKGVPACWPWPTTSKCDSSSNGRMPTSAPTVVLMTTFAARGRVIRAMTGMRHAPRS